MSNFTCNTRSCRVDFWKPSGKWYTTEAVEFLDKYWKGKGDGATLIHEAFEFALRHHFGRNVRLQGMRATCLEPYHEHSHPISLVINWG